AVQPRRLPVAGAMGLQIDIAQDVSHSAGADAGNDTVADGLAGQVVTGPMGDVQPLGYWLQAGKFDDLCPLHRGEAQVPTGVALPVIGEQAVQPEGPIPLAGTPDGGRITPELGSKVFLPLTGGDTQDNASTANLIPRRRVPVRDPLQLADIRR